MPSSYWTWHKGEVITVAIKSASSQPVSHLQWSTLSGFSVCACLFFCYAIEKGVLVWGWWESCVQSGTCSNAESELEREAITATWCVQVSNTQLDSLLYPGDERSSTWALPCCDLAPFGDRESCTHVPTTIHRKHFKQSVCLIHTLFSHASTQFTFFSHWQMLFKYLANSPVHKGSEFSTAGTFTILV